MFGLFAPHAHHFSPKYFDNHKYLKDLVNSTSDTGVMCSEQQCQEGEECCQTIDYGIAYCCSEIPGLMYLGVMIGGGFIIALLFICCFVILRGKEKQLEAAAQLETAKAVSTAMSSAHEAIQLAGEAGAHSAEDLHSPPPSYGDVVRTMQRCHSYDVGVPSEARAQANDVSTSFSRQLSEGCYHQTNSTVSSLPGLPSLPPCGSIESKLPTYEQCTSAAADLSASSIIAQPHMYPIRCNSIQPCPENFEISSATENCCRPNATSGTPIPTVPLTMMEETQLSTPTQVDDDTGIVQSRTSVLSVHEAHAATDLHSDEEPPCGSKDSSVRCRLEFHWNSSSQSEISIGFQSKTEFDNVVGQYDSETLHYENEKNGSNVATGNEVDNEKTAPVEERFNEEVVHSVSTDDTTSTGNGSDASIKERPQAVEHITIRDTVYPTENFASTALLLSCASEIEGRDSAKGYSQQK